MISDPEIPKPIKFNPLKHHRSYILQYLEKSSTQEIDTMFETICHNYIDIYTGSLIPLEISLATINILSKKEVLTEDKFDSWISTTISYRKIKLPDHSKWIIRKGTETDRYIHIHPAKTGAFTIRFKGSTLKTAYSIAKEIHDRKTILKLETVNRARIKIGLSPIKRLEPGKGISKCWNTFFL
ncbi:MAG: hypothetical protein HQ541_23585 [Mariniphaga sp.]|nr:hypothetical protein [Mariniphaga sp.]